MEFLDKSYLPLFASILMALFHGVLFVQSAHDKITDWQGNLGWLTGHFENSIFKGKVPFLLGIITIMELVCGVLSLASIYFTLSGTHKVAALAASLSLLTLLQLFTGQRIAKDYPGAGALVPYFIMSMIWLGIVSAML